MLSHLFLLKSLYLHSWGLMSSLHALQFPAGSASVMEPHLFGCFSYTLRFASKGSQQFQMSWSRVYQGEHKIQYFLLRCDYSEPIPVNSVYLMKLLIVLIQKTDKNLGQLPTLQWCQINIDVLEMAFIHFLEN